jgi:hypothetical protein
LCCDWVPFKEEKCVKIFETKRLLTFDEAKTFCSRADIGSNVLSINSIEEQAFIHDFLLQNNKTLHNIWITSRKNINMTDEQFERILLKEFDNHCVLIIPNGGPFGHWMYSSCNDKSLVVCQKSPTITTAFLHKKFKETSRKLIENQETMKNFRKQVHEIREIVGSILRQLNQPRGQTSQKLIDKNKRREYPLFHNNMKRT